MENADQEVVAQSPTCDTNGTKQDPPAELVDWVRLNRIRGVGPRSRRALLERFGSPQGIFNASTGQLQTVPGVGPTVASTIVSADDESSVANAASARNEIERCRQIGARLISDQGDGYPVNLLSVPDPPGLLYCWGKLLPADALAIAIVGTRHASRYGLGQSEQLASGLARAGFTIVSGLARGIDTSAHEAALAAGGRTIAVLGSGLDHIYPPENRNLAEAIAGSGAVLTEAALDHRPRSMSFPQRNRIVTGLSLGVVVVEAPSRSGAMISAQHALEQNREVFAVPGRVDSRGSGGCHRLIRDGAKLVETVDDILEELGPLANSTPDLQGHQVYHPAELQLNDQERAILDSIEDQASIDEIVCRTALPVQRVLSTLSVLEMKRIIRRLSGTRVSRTF